MGRKIGKILIVLGMIFLLNVLGSRAEEKVAVLLNCIYSCYISHNHPFVFYKNKYLY